MKTDTEALKCKDIADVCELAHKRTQAECWSKGIEIDCQGIMDCTDGSRTHDTTDSDYEIHYSAEAGIIFNRYYDYIINITNL